MNTRESVDLGLTVKWATCNVGASKPEEKGQFFQWGSAKDVTDLSNKLNLENCPYHTGTSQYSGWTKYVRSGKKYYWGGEGDPDGITDLEPSDDAAHESWGGDWRTPTDAEWTELSEGCTWTWTNLEECYGYKVQSKKPGYTDKWIFLPAAGIRLNAKYDSYNECGYYWSSTVAADPNEAYLMFFSTSSIRIAGNSRYCGHSVRPVKE
ncbi:MAG: hypothetical protein MJY67_05610 [Bacteroidales bacterium]|nr:hypothetical protein [Bacteroidales bacterium]